MKRTGLPFLVWSAVSIVAGVTAAPVGAATCESLKLLSLPDATISAAQTIPAGNYTAANGQTYPNLPTFCRVAATATPTSQSSINFEVWLPPAGTWNGIFRGEGSGGSAGAITFALMVNAIQRNYATMSNDNGHTGSNWSFSLQPERVNDFGYRAQHVTTVAAKAIIRAFYQRQQKYSYFYGCSQGGHHALMEAQRYPDDYDGLVAGAFAGIDWTALMFGELWTGVNSSVKGPAFDLPQTQLNLLTNAVLAQCHSQDGGLASDPFLNDPRDCHFDPAVLQCQPGQNPSTCLTASQLQAVEAIYQGASNPRTHQQIWPGFPRGSETFWREVLVGNPNQPGGSSASFFRDGVFAGQPNFNYLNINFDSDVTLTNNKPAGSGETWQEALDANDPDLRPFERRGGKLLMYHGFADPFVTPLASLDYYTAMIGANGEGVGPRAVKETQNFARLFMVPGMTHCGGGPGANVFNGPDNLGGPEDPQHDVFLALRQWVEKGVAPERIIATKYVGDNPANGVAFTRPLCPYPQQARYQGSGSTTDAASFACLSEESDSNGPIIADFNARDTERGYFDLLFPVR
jgi:pimeloyl-ACP methyl ester carboxylesterase